MSGTTSEQDSFLLHFFGIDPKAFGQGSQPAAAQPSPPAKGTRFTDSPTEENTTRTHATPANVDKLAKQDWPELTEAGARTLTSQFMTETSGGNCWNFNLGNIKAGPNDKHMFLHDVRERVAATAADAAVAKANGLAHTATEEEIAHHKWGTAGPDHVWVVYEPPHPQCRFKAFDTLEEGAAKWLDHMKKIAAKDPELVVALNKGDTAEVAHLLKKHGYYTAAEKAYADSMTKQKAQLDKELGT